MHKIELRHLRTLVALRDTGSLVEAGERLSLTQSALSHQIKDIEQRVRCSLFVRKTRIQPLCCILASRLFIQNTISCTRFNERQRQPNSSTAL